MSRTKCCVRFDTGPFDLGKLGCGGIELRQLGIDRFEVCYGMQKVTELDYHAAATELGAAIMHALACEGMLDNRERKR